MSGDRRAAEARRYLEHLRSIRGKRDRPELELLELNWKFVAAYLADFPDTGPRLIDLTAADLDADPEAARDWNPHLAERAAKIGRLFRVIERMDRSPRFEPLIPELSAAIASIKWNAVNRLPPVFPPAAEVTTALHAVTGERWTITGRTPNFYASTFPSEVLSCCGPGGEEIRVLAKYEAGRFQDIDGHRGGPAFEGRVYDKVVAPLGVSAPRCFGLHGDWLFLEYIEGGVRADETASPGETLRLAARWAGDFHRLNAAIAGAGVLGRYRADYYRGWPARTAIATRELHARFPWLPGLCAAAAERLPMLEGAPATVIHGEFTPHNILFRDGTVYPLDWESAAIAPGEIDLASLTDGWAPDIAAACEAEYVLARWPARPPPAFVEILELARLYWHFRWLATAAFVTDKTLRRFERLRLLGERLRLV